MRSCLKTAVSGLLLLTTACNQSSHIYSYRTIIEVDTPEGKRVGSSVTKIRFREGSGFPDDSLHYDITAQAVPIDVPNGTVFALLRGPDFSWDYTRRLIPQHFRKGLPNRFGKGEKWDEVYRYIDQERPSFVLSEDEFPMFAFFADPQQPGSIIQLDPRNLAPLAPGAKVSRITVSVTNDSASDGIYDRLPWLRTWPGSMVKSPFGVPRSERPFASRIAVRDFVLGGD